jgi:hypothetical protein
VEDGRAPCGRGRHHLASKDWLTTADHWDRASAWFRADYLTHAREVIALVQAAAATVPASAPTDQAAAPTAWAYEEACTALNRHRDLAEVRRLALSAALRLGTGAPWDAIRDRAAELAALPEPADRAAIRAAVLREAADFVGNDDDCDCGGCDTCLPRKLAAELRRMADAASGPGGAAGETQQPETQARRMMRSRFPSRPGTATVASDMCPRCKGDNSEAWALCARCAEQQPATQAPGTSPCTCADAGDCFAPAGHYADCPHHAPPAAVSQPDEEA